jgi:hypothetical protein
VREIKRPPIVAEAFVELDSGSVYAGVAPEGPKRVDPMPLTGMVEAKRPTRFIVPPLLTCEVIRDTLSRLVNQCQIERRRAAAPNCESHTPTGG